MKTSAILTIATAALAVTTLQVDAHGGMVNPKPRALTTMGLAIDSTFGFPVSMRGDYTHGKGGNCFGFTPNKNLQNLPRGKSKISIRANDGANHIGPCTAFLVDPQDVKHRIQVGSRKDCMRSLHPAPGNKGDAPIPAELWINVPQGNLPCRDGHCVLQFKLEAQHVTPFEHYNNCADVKIADDGDAPSVPASTPSATPKPTTKTPPADDCF